MVLVVVVAVVCGCLKWKLDRKERDRKALAEIEKAGGGYVYDWQYAGQSAPSGPALLRKLWGDDFFSSVVQVQIEGAHITDDWLVHLEPLVGLERVHLKCPRMTDAGLVHLQRLALRELSLDGSRVTDAGLAQLPGQTGLEYLNLDGTAVTDAGLVHLKTLSRLGYLNLGGTRVTDAGVAELQQALPNCRIDH
jgi:hypothetical protein